MQLVGVGPENQRFEAEKKKGINVKFSSIADDEDNEMEHILLLSFPALFVCKIGPLGRFILKFPPRPIRACHGHVLKWWWWYSRCAQLYIYSRGC